MKKSAIICTVFAITFALCFCLESLFSNSVQVVGTALNNHNLVIDAGHGGIDAGTIGIDNAKEKDINLAIALKLKDFVQVCGIPCSLVRDGDYLVYKDSDDKKRSDLYNRMDYINSINNATMISIHQNHYENEKEWGMQIWYSPNDDKSKVLADNILDITKENLQPDNTRVNKKSDSSYYLLYKAKIPSVMVECGFMSNGEENRKLQQDKYQSELAYSISLGFCEYLTYEE